MTVCNQTITVDATEKEVVFDGIDFTGEARIQLNNAAKVTFKNCRFYRITPNTAKTMMMLAATAVPMVLVVENCFFGANPSEGANVLYHVLEGNFKIGDGSSFSNNYFANGCTTHNIINYYDVEDGATINVNGNHFEYSGSAMRIGPKGAAHCTFNMNNNTYDETDPSENGAWGGLLTIQPYSTQTTSFNDVVVNMNGNVNNTANPQLVVLYANNTDTHYNKETNYPKVYINGVLMEDIPLAPGTPLDESDASTESVEDQDTPTI